MPMMKNMLFYLLLLTLLVSSHRNHEFIATAQDVIIKPQVITEKTKHDTDDPAIWINADNPGQSLILGTDKNEDGALYVFDLKGHVLEDKTVRGLRRPNNVDVEYGILLNGANVDIAAVTERFTNKLRLFRLPDMQPIDNGGIEVFVGEEKRSPMGIALYKRPRDGAVYAIVSRKKGPTSGTYLWQYLLKDSSSGYLTGIKAREFGMWSGTAEIEAVAVDDELGFVYYSDESTGVRKYHADPDHPDADKELALFGQDFFLKDREGISIYCLEGKTGYILVSDQGANKFCIFKREAEPGNPHLHNLIKTVHLSTGSSDGSDVTNIKLNDMFSCGLFVAMSDDKTFHYYSWTDIAGNDLRSAMQIK